MSQAQIAIIYRSTVLEGFKLPVPKSGTRNVERILGR
jgi:hypothetical protein